MAYKFQRLAATMSGSLTQEGDIAINNESGATVSVMDQQGVISGSSHLEAGGNLQTAGTVKFTGVADTAIAVASDALYFKDADGTMKSDTVADLMTAAAGAGLAASSGVLAVDELAAGTTLHQTQDHFMFSDNGTEKKITFSDVQDSVFADVSGDATVAAGGALTIAADAVQASMLNDDCISGFTNLGGTGVDDADEFLFSDGGSLKALTFANLRDAGFADVSGDATIAAGGALTIAANAVQTGMVHDDVATELAGDGLAASSGVLAINVSGAIHTTSDKLGISGSIAGAGLTYAGGVDSILSLALDIDELAALGGTGVAQGDHFLFSDAGTEKKITFSNMEDAIFGNVSGDATIAAGGALTIAAGAVENSMLADDAVGADELAANAVVEASIVDNAVTLAKMAGLTRGSIILGDASGDPSALAKGGAATFLQSDGTDPSYVSISGDATVAAGGALTIAANAIQTGMVHDDVATELAGAGLSAASGVMALDLNELTAEAIASGDFLSFVDSTDNGTHKESIDDIATLFAGDGLAASSAVLAVAVSGAVHVSSDKVSISGSIAGPGLGYVGGVDSILGLELDIDELSALGGTGVAQGDHFVFSDAGIEKKITFSNMEDAIFGNVSGDATIAAGGALTIAADAVEGSMLNDNVISGQTELASDGLAAADELMISDAGSLKKIGIDNLMKDGPGLLAAASVDVSADHFMFLDGGATGDAKIESIADVMTATAGIGLVSSAGVLSIELSEVGAAAVDVANDQIAFLDANDSDVTKRESVADLVAAMAGAGLSAASGQLSVTGNNVASKADGDTLVEGYNYFADLSSNATVAMPTSPSTGDVVTVKAKNLTSGAKVIVNKAGSQTIDGLTSIEIESPYGAVTMVLVAANDWRIV